MARNPGIDGANEIYSKTVVTFLPQAGHLTVTPIAYDRLIPTSSPTATSEVAALAPVGCRFNEHPY
jgi:hypothetical protein